jgi:hypothetical protein
MAWEKFLIVAYDLNRIHQPLNLVGSPSKSGSRRPLFVSPPTEVMLIRVEAPVELKKAARDRNLMAISCLTMAFQDDALLNVIELSETVNY